MRFAGMAAWVMVLVACGGGGGGTSGDPGTGGNDLGGGRDDAVTAEPGPEQDIGAPDNTVGQDIPSGQDLTPGQDVTGGEDLTGGADHAADPGAADVSTADDQGTQPDSTQADTGGTYHPAGWATPGSQNFHGDEAKQGIAACTACHGSDLTGGAVSVSCETCHSGFKTNCTFCHGGVDTDKGSPPVDIHDKTSTSEVTVGAHTAHVTAKSGLAAPFDCTKCHQKPSSALDPGHVDGSPAEVLPALGWDRTKATCTTGYCHGNFAGGNSANHPVWTQTGQAPCGSCHALPPSTGRHPSVSAPHSFMGKDCTNCHNGIANNGATQILNPDLHVNGTKDVALKAGGTWDPSTKTCDPACHGAEQW